MVEPKVSLRSKVGLGWDGGMWRGGDSTGTQKERGDWQAQTSPSLRFCLEPALHPFLTCPTLKSERKLPACSSLIPPALATRTELKQVLISALYNLAPFKVQEACVDWPGDKSIKQNDVSKRKCMLESNFGANVSFLDWGLLIIGADLELLLSTLTWSKSLGLLYSPFCEGFIYTMWESIHILDTFEES